MKPTAQLGQEWLGEHAWEELSFFEMFVVSAAIHTLYLPRRSSVLVGRALIWWWRGPWAPREGSLPRGWMVPHNW